MLRSNLIRLHSFSRRFTTSVVRKYSTDSTEKPCFTCNMPYSEEESEEDFNTRWEEFFNNPEIDHWEIRQGINLLAGMDLIPEPKIQIAIMKACRRLNDYALTVRYLESMKFKADAADKKIYPYIMQEIGPVLEELGIDTPEKLGYDKPELHMPNVYEYSPK